MPFISELRIILRTQEREDHKCRGIYRTFKILNTYRIYMRPLTEQPL